MPKYNYGFTNNNSNSDTFNPIRYSRPRMAKNFELFNWNLFNLNRNSPTHRKLLKLFAPVLIADS